MNILFVEQGYPSKSFGGGAGAYVQLVAKELVKRGHRTFVISRYLDNEPEEHNDGGVIIRRVKIKGWHWYFTKIPLVGRVLARFFRIVEYSLAINREIKKHHKKYKLDLVEFSEAANFLYSLQIGLPYIIHLHGSDYTLKKYCGEKIFLEDKLQRYLEGLFIKKADFITSPSEFLKKEIIHEFNIDNSKISVIPYPLDERLLAIPIGFNKDIKTIFYAGRLEERKGIHILKEIIPLVVKEYPDIKFLFFGSNYEEMTKESLMNYLEEKKVKDKVEIHPFIPKERLFDYLAKADICVTPSLWDNSPNTIYEAMAAGKTVVATYVGGIPELVIDGITGMLIEPNNPFLLSQAIIDLLKDDNKKRVMGTRARKIVRKRFKVDKIVQERLKVYKKAQEHNNEHRYSQSMVPS